MIYLDMYFLVNLTADLLLLCFTGRVLHFKSRFLRTVGAASLGAACSVISVIFGSTAADAIIGILTPAAMLFAAFGKTETTRFFKAYLLLFGCSFAAGGIFAAAGELLSEKTDPKLIFAASFVIFFFCFFFFDIFQFSKDSEYIDIVIEKDREQKKLTLLCDSGCLVREPIGGLPVILLSPKVFDGLYPEAADDAYAAVRQKKRLVPIRTASGSSVICAVMPEKLFYIYKNTAHPCNAMLGRSQADSFAGLDGIFPKNLLQ